MHKRLFAALVAFLALLAGPVLALCAGQDRLAALNQRDPAAHAALMRAAQAAPFASGRFWRIEKAGKVSHLFGTYHDPDPEIAALPAAVADRIDAARLVMVEVTKAEMGRMEQSFVTDPGQIFARDTPPLSARLSPAAMERLGRILPGYGMSLEVVEGMQPWFLTMLLAQPPCALQMAASGKPVLDAVIMERAEAAGIPVKGLETASEALAALRPPRPEDELAMLDLTIASAVEAEDFRATSKILYLAGETRMIWEFSLAETRRLIPGPEADRLAGIFDSRLIAGRNRTWMAHLLPELAQGDALVAVGALHLPGESGLLALLAADGYSVTRADPGL